MEERKFDPAKLAKLNDPGRLEDIPPRVIWEELALESPQVFVDIGAGTGFFDVALAKSRGSIIIYACDISDVMLDWMKQNLAEVMDGIIVPIKMEERSVPLDDGIADLVFMINLHHELDDPPAIIREAYRLLKRGGKLMIIDWKREETPSGPPVEIRINAEAIESQVREGGFSQVTIHPVLQYHTFVTGLKE